MKRTILFLLAAATAVSCLFAQTTKNPFSELGYKKQITYTSSKGEFEEFHDNVNVVEIGSVYFNTKTNKVVGYINEEKENAEVATATSAMSVDPLCEKYYWISPYAYCLNNPVKYIDPDGRVVRIANNTAGALNNMAKIVATNQGQTVYNRLINSRQTYETNSVFWTRSSSYDNESNTINYVGNTWYSNIDGGSASNEVIMGHETYHAFQDDNFQIQTYNGVIKNTLEMERGAVSFENYMRSVYGDTQFREKYSGLAGGQEGKFQPFNLNTNNEKISNFTAIGNNEGKTSFGFSYIKESDSQKKQTYYLVVSADKNNNFSYQIYTSQKEYEKATSNW